MNSKKSIMIALALLSTALFANGASPVFAKGHQDSKDNQVYEQSKSDKLEDKDLSKETDSITPDKSNDKSGNDSIDSQDSVEKNDTESKDSGNNKSVDFEKSSTSGDSADVNSQN